MRTVLLVLFSVAWAAVAFAVLRAIVVAWGFHRRLATATAFAVAAAFALGSASPFSLTQRVAQAPAGAPAPPAAPAAVQHPIACPAGAKVVKTAGAGHIDSLMIDGAVSDVAKPASFARNAAVRLGGWVVAAGGPATGMCVLVDGKPVSFEGLYGLDRPDVAAAMNKPEDRGSGFDLAIRVPPGTHVVTVGPMQADGTLTPLGQPLTMQVH